FAAAWSACFETGIVLAAQRRKTTLPAGVTIEAEVDLSVSGGDYFLSARFKITLPGVERAAAQALIDEAHRTCPYSKATRGNMSVAIRLVP
ncbi:MAG: OsmC family protein, partial [Gammaproteobacteria bacterium]